MYTLNCCTRTILFYWFFFILRGTAVQILFPSLDAYRAFLPERRTRVGLWWKKRYPLWRRYEPACAYEVVFGWLRVWATLGVLINMSCPVRHLWIQYRYFVNALYFSTRTSTEYSRISSGKLRAVRTFATSRDRCGTHPQRRLSVTSEKHSSRKKYNSINFNLEPQALRLRWTGGLQRGQAPSLKTTSVTHSFAFQADSFFVAWVRCGGRDTLLPGCQLIRGISFCCCFYSSSSTCRLNWLPFRKTSCRRMVGSAVSYRSIESSDCSPDYTAR